MIVVESVPQPRVPIKKPRPLLLSAPSRVENARASQFRLKPQTDIYACASVVEQFVFMTS
jgi:hypothetical protein